MSNYQQHAKQHAGTRKDADLVVASEVPVTVHSLCKLGGIASHAFLQWLHIPEGVVENKITPLLCSQEEALHKGSTLLSLHRKCIQTPGRGTGILLRLNAAALRESSKAAMK